MTSVPGKARTARDRGAKRERRGCLHLGAAFDVVYSCSPLLCGCSVEGDHVMCSSQISSFSAKDGRD